MVAKAGVQAVRVEPAKTELAPGLQIDPRSEGQGKRRAVQRAAAKHRFTGALARENVPVDGFCQGSVTQLARSGFSSVLVRICRLDTSPT